MTTEDPTNWRTRFPDAELVIHGEGESVYRAEDDGAWWLIFDAALMNELVDDPDDWVSPVTLRRFDDRLGLEAAVTELRGRRLRVEVDRLLMDAALPLARRLSERASELGKDRLTEARDLQPVALEVLRATATAGLDVGRERRVDFDLHWARLGSVDLAIEAGELPPAFVELKGGAGREALAACAWDAEKLATSLRLSACSCAYLMAIAPTNDWRTPILGAELFDGGSWSAWDVRSRYGSWWRHWEKQGYKPTHVPPALDTHRLVEERFEVAGIEWLLRVARVNIGVDGWFSWEPFLP